MSSYTTTHRFYKNELPKVGDLVVVEVTKIDTMGVYCQLVEYNFHEGFIPTPELTHLRYRKISQASKIGKQEVTVVLRVDNVKGMHSHSQHQYISVHIYRLYRSFQASC